MSRIGIRYETPPLDASLATVNYVAMFHSAWHIRRHPFYYFELQSKKGRHSGWTLFVMHHHFLKKFLRYCQEVEMDLSVILISSSDSVEVEPLRNLTMKEIAYL